MKKLALSALVISLATGCSNMQSPLGAYQNTGLYGGIGAAVGGVTGALIDHDNRGRGAALGALVAGGAGAAYGYNADKMEAEVRQKIGAELASAGISIKRVGENTVSVTIPDQIAFVPGTSTLTPFAYKVLDEMGRIMGPHADVAMSVIATNPKDPTENFALARERAQVVAHQLAARGVSPQRLTLGVHAPQVDLSWSAVELTAQPLNQMFAQGRVQQQHSQSSYQHSQPHQQQAAYQPAQKSAYVAPPRAAGNPYANNVNPYANNGGQQQSPYARAGMGGLIRGMVTAITQGPEAGLRAGVGEVIQQGSNAATREARGAINDEVNDIRYDR